MDSLLIYKSSAGSGKTFTLVLSYLKIVLAHPEAYRQVLAVTFTNKATEEMKNRIISALDALATTAPDDLGDLTEYQLLRAYFDQFPDGSALDIQAQARRVLNRILNDYTNFSISTIERFFQRVVRAFARELHIPLGYEVEMRQDLVLDQIVGDTLLEIGRNDHLTKLFRGFVERNLAEERGWQVDREVKQLGIEIFKEQYQTLVLQGGETPVDGVGIDAVLTVAKEIQTIRRTFEQGMAQQAQEALALIREAGLEIADFKYGKNGPAHYFINVLDKKFEPGKRAREAATAEKAWVTAKSPRKAQINALLPVLMSYMDQLVDRFDRTYDRYNTALQVSRTIYAYGVLNDLQQKLQHYRRDHAQMLISDTSFLLQAIIGEEFDAPFIYEKVGTRFRHFLLDEFQDTSRMQWQNLLPLVKESLAQGAQSLMVGDVKQSIYRWRNGDLRLLLNQVEEDMKVTGQIPKVEDLSNNWRTAKDIVEFNNVFFEQAAELLGETCMEDQALFEAAYEVVAQEPKKEKIAGFVELACLADSSQSDEGQGSTWKDRALARTLTTIQSLRQEGFRGKDITLLVRTNKEGIELVEYLQRHQERVVSAESLLLISDPKVRLLEALLGYLNHENDEIALAAMLYHHHRITYSTEAPLLFHHPHDPIQVLSDELREKLRMLSVYECAELLLHTFGLRSVANAYLQGFMDAILEYASMQDASLDGFLQWWAEEKHQRSVAASLDSEAVQVMTIHKAKGLEFPVVIIPFADWSLAPSSRGFLWVAPQTFPYETLPFVPVRPGKSLQQSDFQQAYEIEATATKLDSLNILYVAFTRPQYRLYVFTKRVKVSDQLKRVSQLLDVTLKRTLGEDELKTVGEEEVDLVYHVGKGSFLAANKKREGANDAPNIVVQGLSGGHRPWQASIRIKFAHKRSVDFQLLQTRQHDGNLVHDLLAKVFTYKDIPDAVASFITRGIISDVERQDWAHRLETIVRLPEVMDWFSDNWSIRNEGEIITPEGKLLRPDRVMIQKNRALVVDYKTGNPSPGYEAQVQRYIEVLEQMGYAQVEGYVYYLSLAKVDRIGGQLSLAL